MSVTLLRGDARRLGLADSSVDLIVTSPPYFALRSYTDGGEHYAGQVGSEATPREFVAALVECTREWTRVLKPTGSIWVNLGDKYSGAQAQNIKGKSRAGDSARTWAQTNPRNTGIPNKSLMGLPWRYALACIDELGLILRAEVIWDKPNGLPESVTDRARRSHEQWFHFTIQPRYFAAVDEIREPYAPETAQRYQTGYKQDPSDAVRIDKGYDEPDGGPAGTNPLGKLPGSVWSIASQPLVVPKELGVDHYAAFPMEWPRRLILGWSPSAYCCGCNQPRRPVVTPTGERGREPGGRDRVEKRTYAGLSTAALVVREIIDYACACPDASALTRPAVVLDPFGGTGTTAMVASALGRHGISNDMSADYGRLATWRTTDPKQMARAARPATPRPQTLDASLGKELGSGAMTSTSEDVKQIQDRNAEARGRVINAGLSAADLPDIEDAARIVEAAMMELAKIWREDAAAMTAAKRRGHVAVAKELTQAAGRLAGFAVGLSTRASTWTPLRPGPTPEELDAALVVFDDPDLGRTVDVGVAVLPCEHPAESLSLLKSDGQTLCTACQTVIEPPATGPAPVPPSLFDQMAHLAPQPTGDATMDFLTGATNTYAPNPFTSPQITPTAAAPAIIDNPFTSPAAPGARSGPARNVARLAYPQLPVLAAKLAEDPRTELSHSFVETYERCSLKSMLDRASRHELIGPTRPTWSLIGGIAFHNLIEAVEKVAALDALHRTPLPAGPLLAPSPDVVPIDVVGEWTKALDELVNENAAQRAGTAYGDPATWYAAAGGKEGYDWWRVEGATMVAKYLTFHGRAWRAAHRIGMARTMNGIEPMVELEFKMIVPQTSALGTSQLTTQGRIDAVWLSALGVDAASAAEGRPVVFIDDWKTGSRKPADTFQLGEYAHGLLAVAPELGNAIITGRYWMARRGEYVSATPALEVHTADEIAYRYRQAAMGAQFGIFTPTRTDMCAGCTLVDYCPAITS
jgi:DNA modification methylase